LKLFHRISRPNSILNFNTFANMSGSIQFRKKQYVGGDSLSKHAKDKLLKNSLAMIALYFILFICVISTLGYLITPDSTPFANQQILEISSLKPGSKVQFLHITKGQNIPKKNFIDKMISGQYNDYTPIPINNFKFEERNLIVELYTKSQTGGQIKSFSSEDVITPNSNNNTSNEFSSLESYQSFIKDERIKSKRFLLGTDRYGRDYLSRLIIGARVSLSVGFISVFISLIIGITLGCFAGFFGGKIDNLILWLINVIWSIPTLLLVIAITFALGKGFWQVFIAVGLTMWVEVARVVRGQVLGMKEKEFVEAGRALGFKNSRIIFNHILPNIISPIIVISAANFAAAILIEAGLSFLGIGIQPPMPSWGSMIKENYAYIILDSAYLAILPGIAIMLMVLAFMILGNGLREALNVKEQQI